MSRACFTLEIRPGQEERYDRLHTEMGEAMEKAVSDSGLSNYTLFRLGSKVVGYVETQQGFEESMKELVSKPAFEAWARLFGGVFVESEGNVAELTRYEEIWHVD